MENSEQVAMGLGFFLGFFLGILLMAIICSYTFTHDNELLERDLAYYDAKSGLLVLKDLTKD